MNNQVDSDDELLDMDEETMDALLRRALDDFEKCRTKIQNIQDRRHNSIGVSSSNPAPLKVLKYKRGPGALGTRGRGKPLG